ncbi:MAG: ABC transporter ATP-binding protein [Candidatus Thermoplasmatota archaeon]|nr:ABC transporter ATP-binding protein [Candidatus Thermoplasmatota archaeon]
MKNVTKTFGTLNALEDFSIDIEKGAVIGLVGSNGAGKTTLLRLLCGLYRPNLGNVVFVKDGKEKNIDKFREAVGVLPESTGLYHRLTAWENIRYHSRLHGVPDSISWERTLRFSKALSMSDDLMRHTRGFSRGMRQKTALLRALAHGPEILLLDEPTAGLDVTSARLVRKLVHQLKEEGGTVIYSTHNLSEAEKVCDRIIILHNGQLRFDGSNEDLLLETETKSLEDAYVKLTSDDARIKEKEETEGWFAKKWRHLFTRKINYTATKEDE